MFQILGDVTKTETLSLEYFQGVRKVINSVSVIVGPKEGDTPDRAKYSQVCICLYTICMIQLRQMSVLVDVI